MSDDTKALVLRLRHAYDDLSDDALDAILIEAADTIERLERELAEARLRIAILLDPDDDPSAGDYECTR